MEKSLIDDVGIGSQEIGGKRPETCAAAAPFLPGCGSLLNRRKEIRKMDKSKKYVLIALGLLLLLGVFVFDQPQAQNPKPPDKVQVVNADGTAPGTVALAGGSTVGINNQPNVTAFKGGSWDVSINGTPPVTVANTSLAPVFVRDVDNPARQPFQTSVAISIPNGASGSEASFPVPSMKRLVIEYVSTSRSNLSAGQGFIVAITLGSGLIGPTNFLGTSYAGGWVAVSQTTRLYADPGTSVNVTFDLLGGATCAIGPCVQRVHLSGYLVDL